MSRDESREGEIRSFLKAQGWDRAQRQHLAGDASARRYERLQKGDQKAILMDAPLGCGDDAGDFLRIAEHLAALGLSPPKAYGSDLALGLVLLEDLGDEVYSTVVERSLNAEITLYSAAAEVLIRLHQAAPPDNLPDLSADDWAESALFATRFYARAILGQAPEDGALREALADALKRHADGPRVTILRDYHAGNLLWLPEREGLARVGLLDFQLAQLAQPEYDLVSLLQDARRDLQQGTEAEILARWAQWSGKPEAEFRAAYATLGALRALRILGIFARLCMVAGKEGYLVFLPRVWGQLQENLQHPALSALKAVCDRLLPPPTPDNIQEIKAKCGIFSSL